MQIEETPRLIGFVGFSGSGKTTLLLKLIAIARSRGLRVATLKHAHHKFDIDTPGKDSYRHREAGAEQVLVASHKRWALMRELPAHSTDADRADRATTPYPETPLPELISHIQDVDLIFVEGFKQQNHPKIEVCRGSSPARLDRRISNLVALASDQPQDTKLTQLDINQPETWFDQILSLAAPVNQIAFFG